MRRHPLWPWLEMWIVLLLLWLAVAAVILLESVLSVPSGGGGEEGLAIPDLHAERGPGPIANSRNLLGW